jgi:glycosyltransferase involved in cell wall biosynthesis
MVIAHILSSLQIGGQERVALDLAALQVKGGHRVLLVSLAPPPDGPLAPAFRAAGVTVVREPKGPDGLDFTLSLRLARLFRREHVDVVHAHNRMPLIYSAPAGKLAGAVVIHTRHGSGRGSKGEEWLRKVSGRFLDAYVGVSPELVDLARELGDCADEKLTVIENGVDLERFQPNPETRRAARAKLGIPDDAWVVGSVGRLAPEKNYPLLVRAVAPLLGPGVRLAIAGDGPTAEAIRAEVRTHGVEAFVHLPGALDDVAPFVTALDAFALSSEREGLPLAVLEAMSVGLPVVATAVGGLPALLTEGQTGFLVPRGDAEALRARVAALCAEPARAEAVGRRGQQHARSRYAREVMNDRYLRLYAQCGARR